LGVAESEKGDWLLDDSALPLEIQHGSVPVPFLTETTAPHPGIFLMRTLVFEDRHVADLYPITLTRPAFAVTCGSFRLVDHVDVLGGNVHAAVRPHIHAVAEADFMPPLAGVSANDVAGVRKSVGQAGPVLLVNARLVPSFAARETLARIAREGGPCAVTAEDALAAAVVLDPARLVPDSVGPDRIPDINAAVSRLGLPERAVELPLIEYPHDAVRYHLATIADNLHARIRWSRFEQIREGVFVRNNVHVAEHVAFDTRKGPVLLESGSCLEPFVCLRGPVYVGAHSRVLDHASLKDGVSAGEHARLGGEIEGCVMESYSNKQHHGFLGHAYCGSWTNLGAGTSNSDLKNTYGPVTMTYSGTRVSTGMQFMGCILADYCKTAIHTAIFTGKMVGVCSMLYGTVTEDVPSYVNYAPATGHMTEVALDVAVRIQARMYERRHRHPRDCDVQLLRDVYTLTSQHRHSSAVSSGLGRFESRERNA